MRDAALLAEMGRQAPVYVTFSITTTDEGVAKALEPGAPTGNQRFAAMEKLAQAGVFTGTWISPMVPFLTDSPENLLSLVEKTKECGGRFVICHFGMTLRTGNREYFYAGLDKVPRFAGIKGKFVNAFGLEYQCTSPRAEELYPLYQERCDQLGLLHGFEAIDRALREASPTQLSLL